MTVIAGPAAFVLALLAPTQGVPGATHSRIPFTCERRVQDADAALDRAVNSDDRLRRREAAHELLHRHRHVDAALRTFLATADEPGDVLAEHAIAFAGTAFIDVACAELAALPDGDGRDALRARVFALADRARLGPAHQLRLLAEYAAYAQADGQRAVDVLRRLRALDAPQDDLLAPQSSALPRTANVELDRAIEATARRALADPAGGGAVVARSIDAVAKSLHGSEPAYASVVARLAELLPRADDASEAALAALCDMTPSDPEVVRRCVAHIDALQGDAPRVFERLVEPRVLLPRVGQAAANAALDRLAKRARDVAGAGRCVALARTFDAVHSALAERVLAACADGSPRGLDYADWNALVAADTGWELAFSDSDTPAVRVQKVLVNARTHRAHGVPPDGGEGALLALFETAHKDDEFGGTSGPNDPFGAFVSGAASSGLATPALVDRVLGLALDHGLWSSDIRALTRFLASTTLTPSQRECLARLAREGALLGFESLDDMHAYTALLARQGRDSVAAAARVRALAQLTDDFANFADLLAIDAPTESDLAWLASAITEGAAARRADALELVARYSLDTPRLRASTRTACADIDTFVAQAARELCVTRGW